MLNQQQIAEAAALLVKAHEDRKPFDGFPDACRPTTLEDGYAIQDIVAAKLGATVGGYKAIADIFKAGVWTGIVLVIVVVALVVWLISRSRA